MISNSISFSAIASVFGGSSLFSVSFNKKPNITQKPTIIFSHGCGRGYLPTSLPLRDCEGPSEGVMAGSSIRSQL